MSWANFAIKLLQEGNMAIVKPAGNSMKGKIESHSRVTLEPVKPDELEIGDIVLCKVKGNVYLHIIKSIDKKRFLIGNNCGGINGWTRTIYGRVINIEPPKK